MQRLREFFVVGILGIVLSACEAKKDYRGNVLLNSEIIEYLKERKGCINKDEVREILGDPSFSFTFDPQTWHYINQTIQIESLLPPKVTDSKGYTLHFALDGRLDNIKKAKGTIDLVIAPQETSLPSTHREEFLKQLFRNVGRFSPIAPNAR